MAPSQAPSPAGLAAQDAKLGLDDFISLAKSYSVIPVWKEVVADTLTPVAAFLRAVGHKEGFLLESVEGGERWGRYSFIGRAPLARVVARGAQVHTKGALLKGMETGSGILKACEDILAAYHTPEMDGLPPLHSGLVGYLGYDVVREVESLPGSPPDDLNLPDAVLDVIGELVAIDHWRQRCVVIANVMVDPEWTDAQLASAYQSAVSKIHNLIEDLSTVQEESLTEPPDPHESSVEALRTVGSQQYRTWVEIAKEHILEGDIFQVVLSQRFDFDLQADPFDVYRVLRMVNPSPYLYFLRSDEATIAGASPEPMVRVRDGTVISRPIAGTRPRGSTPTQDRLFAAELAEDPKELAEHVMLVDLARNDVGRVARYGSVNVDELMVVERYSHVMHLTSQVSGLLLDGRGPIDVLRATFPAGTLSGAPKVRAMEIIDELETTKRGIYGGVIGYLDFSGNLDTAIAIRTMVVTPHGHGCVQAGAGLVADSDPVSEDQECVNKAAAVLSAVAAARRMGQNRAAQLNPG